METAMILFVLLGILGFGIWYMKQPKEVRDEMERRAEENRHKFKADGKSLFNGGYSIVGNIFHSKVIFMSNLKRPFLIGHIYIKVPSEGQI